MTTKRVQASLREGAGYRIPERNPAHADPDWYQLDKDDLIEDPDEPFVDPLPTARHRSVPTDL